MPSTRAIARAFPGVLPAVVRLVRAFAWLLVLGIGVFAALLLAVRLVLFPNVEQYRDDITRAISKQIHEPVEIAGLATGWDGWNPKLVMSGFRVGAPAADGSAGLLELPRVELTLSWTSIPLLEPRLRELVIDSPRLAVRRDAAGVLHVAGIEIDPAGNDENSAFSDWLLRQPQIVVRNALITWLDQRRNAPQLVLDRVTFRLESSFGGHRFGVTGEPPAELAAPIDIRGDVRGRSIREWQKAEGQFYVRLDYADIAAWREWLPLPVALDSGKGALRAWFTFADGQLREVVADVELADVRTRLTPEVDELALSHVSGRAGWRLQGTAREVYCRGLAFRTEAGQAFAPTDASLVLRTNDAGVVEHGRLEFERVELGPLRELAQNLPITDRWRAELIALAPHGSVAKGMWRWDGPADAPTSFEGRGDFTNVGWAPLDDWPGASGMSGTLKATSRGGEVKLTSRNGLLVLPRVLPQSVPLETLRADVTWTLSDAQLGIHVDDLAFANPDLAGKLRVSYRHGSSGPGIVDLDGTISRASPQAAARYTPLVFSPGLREWLASAVPSGHIDEVKLKVKGDLASFPFADGKSGTFAADVKGHDLTLVYAEGWPSLTAVNAEAHFHNAGLRIDDMRGRMYGVEIAHTSVTIPDLRAAVLSIDGSAAGPIGDFLRFVNDSPVHEWIDEFTHDATAVGDGRLGLKFTLPLRDEGPHTVNGEFAFVNDQVRLPGVPVLDKANGRITFTHRDVRGRDITAEALGGPVRIALAVNDGRTRVNAAGTASMQAVGREFRFPLAQHVSGAADYTLLMDSRGDATSWTVESALKGIAIELPAPLGKSASEARPLRIERRAIAAGEDTLTGTLGEGAEMLAHRRVVEGSAIVDRLLVSLGRTPRVSDWKSVAPGMWIRANVSELDVDQWLAVRREGGGSTAGGSDDLDLNGIDIDAGVLTAFGRNFNALKVSGRRSQEDWKLELAGREVAGTANWFAPNDRAPNGRVVARLARLTTPPAHTGSANAGSADDASSWPELDIAAEGFQSRGHDLGRLELVAKPSRGEWRIERLVLANDAGRIDASGAWRAGGAPAETRLDVALDASDGGAYLARFGYPGLVQGAPTKITGQLAWAGDPSDFDYPTLSGGFHLDVGSGRFVKVQPGIGKLLGVLSLQALPRRITLDFRDVFSEGFSFDRVTGDVRIARGVMSSDNLRLAGPAAQVAIAGQADLSDETQTLKVRVQPTLSAGVSAGAALMFLANPVIGAAVGAGSLLAQKVLRDPIEQMFSYEYAVTGSWSDPHVARTGPATAAAADGAAVK